MKKFFENIYGKAASAAVSLMIADQAFASSQSQANFNFNTMASNAKEGLKGATGSVLNIVAILVLIIGGVMLLWAFIKRSKNDGQGNDALVGWGVGLIITFLALEIIKLLVDKM